VTGAVVVRGGHLVDGTGSPARDADVWLRDGRVERVVDYATSPPADATVMDASGLTLAPGFVDVHSHADNAPFLDDDDTSKLLQGVTCEVVGNCGFSLAPRLPGHAEELEALVSRIFPPLPWGWSSFGELLEALDARGYVVNYAPLVGHHALRVAVTGMRSGPPDEGELSRMGDLLDDAVAAGGFGLSSGLIYPPGVFSGTAELAALARRLPPGLPYVTHMRGEGSMLLRSIAEAIDVARSAGRPLHVSHLKSAGRDNWGRMNDALALLDEGRAAGMDIRQDVYPYTAGSTMLTAALPPWMNDDGADALLARLESTEVRQRLRAELGQDHDSWENHIYGAGWDGIVIASSATHEHDGRSLAEVAERLGQDRVNALAGILRTERLQVSMIVHSMHEPDLVRALQHPSTMIGSDGLPPGLGGRPHPRTYGTFPRVLARYVRELGVFPLEEAVRRMTSLPAAAFRLRGRGRVAPGLAADLVAFDADAVRDVATYDDPARGPEGIAWVMVNGEMVVEGGVYAGRRAGHRLHPPPAGS